MTIYCRINPVTAQHVFTVSSKEVLSQQLQSHDILYAPLPRSLKEHKSPSVSKKIK